ncbi:hypothetical protein PVAND_009630 [Polypedilum vanderplanki]|uniref:Rab-GAP TBC domain-containing protein n=1 Tax=Polypedilum vanderplanki TaxID=319348 RepID=A0A9J6CE57_POLVA|nr:hypothetical protein PVAND_009630 [Polypedilum vanderplanki]
MTQISDIDEYGFKRSEEEKKFREQNEEYFLKITNSSIAWEKFISSSSLSIKNNILIRSYTLKNFIRKGVPKHLRKDIWLKTSGCEKQIAQHPNLYNDLIRNLSDKEINNTIKIDIPRTFPDNIFFDQYKVPLYNVLSAFADHNPIVSYCQGLNYIAGLLLIVCSGDEKASFWLLKHFVENIAPEYHTKTMKGLKRDIEVITDLIKMHAPSVNEKMFELSLPWIVIMTKWFICFFAETLDTETTLRVWDIMFAEGYKIIFRASLAIVLILKDDIMKADDINDLAELFRNIAKDPRFLNSHSFINFMLSLKIKRRQLSILRRNHLQIDDSKNITDEQIKIIANKSDASARFFFFNGILDYFSEEDEDESDEEDVPTVIINNGSIVICSNCTVLKSSKNIEISTESHNTEKAEVETSTDAFKKGTSGENVEK